MIHKKCVAMSASYFSYFAVCKMNLAINYSLWAPPGCVTPSQWQRTGCAALSYRCPGVLVQRQDEYSAFK